MNNNIINKYTNEILYNKLIEMGIKEIYVQEITLNIKEQIYSVVYNWNDIYFRKGLLVIWQEEGKFYEPEADLVIKNFVVVAVRNSLLEIPFSVESKKVELREPLPEENIKIITSDAINYFKNIDFYKLCQEVQKEEIKDKYKEITNKYPMAWKAICELGNCNSKKTVYTNVEVKDKIRISDLEVDTENESKEIKKFVEDTQSGISEKFSEALVNNIKNILECENGVLYADCFKMVTRNFEKLLKLIEILLENNKVFLTSNYLITNSYISKREEIYRASHTNNIYSRIKSPEFLVGLSKTHRGYLAEIVKNFG